MENELVQIFELLVALVAAIVAYWQHRQKGQAVEAREEALIEKEVAEALQFAAESEKNDVVSYFDPADGHGDQASGISPGQILEDER